MKMAGFALKVKTKSGQKVLDGLSPTDKVSSLKTKLSEITGIPVGSLCILGGYPPKALDLQKETATLEESAILSGDTLIIEEKEVLVNGDSDKIEVETGRTHVANDEDFAKIPGILMKKVVPADNSCLFTSVGYVLNGKVDPSCAKFMRQLIATAVAADPEEYSEAILGRPNAEYCEWIQQPDSWGGAIELAILSHSYGLEIAVVDSINAIINRFGEDRHYAQRVFLIFDGIHYDPLYLEPLDGGSIQTIFPSDDDKILLEAAEIAKEAKSSRQFTDVEKFTLKCMDCDIRLNGQAAAQQHAKETGHINFGEMHA